MDPTQALVAIWLNVAPENTEEFRKWHNCEHSTDRMDGPGFRVGYRYNAVDENANHNILCTFEGDTLGGVYERLLQGIEGQSQARGQGSAWPSSKTRSARSTAYKPQSARRTVLMRHTLYMVSPNPGL